VRIYLSGVTRRALANSLLGCPWADPLAALVIAADAVKGAQRLACRELLRPERERAQRDPSAGTSTVVWNTPKGAGLHRSMPPRRTDRETDGGHRDGEYRPLQASLVLALWRQRTGRAEM